MKESKENYNWWTGVYMQKIGYNYLYKKDFSKSSLYFLNAIKSFEKHNQNTENAKENDYISATCYYSLSELLNGNLDKSQEAVNLAEPWLNDNSLKTEKNNDYDAYLLYWPPYLYYKELNHTENALKYLEMAYEIVGKEKIDKYHQFSEKDTHPQFFYCRDIIIAYETSMEQ